MNGVARVVSWPGVSRFINGWPGGRTVIAAPADASKVPVAVLCAYAVTW
jgi:hypothetical protein